FSSSSCCACILSVTVIIFLFTSRCPLTFNTPSLHDALPICRRRQLLDRPGDAAGQPPGEGQEHHQHKAEHEKPELADFPALLHEDRKSTRLNSSHVKISYADFCLKKKKYKTSYIVSLRSY